MLVGELCAYRLAVLSPPTHRCAALGLEHMNMPEVGVEMLSEAINHSAELAADASLHYSLGRHLDHLGGSSLNTTGNECSS